MKIELLSNLMTLLGLARSQGVDIQMQGNEPLKFDKSKGSPELHQQIHDEFNDRVSTQAQAMGISRRDFMKTPMALTAAAAAVSAGFGLSLWPSQAMASAPGAGPYSFLILGNPIIPDPNPVEAELPKSKTEGKIALIIGGSRGMGEQTARKLVHEDRGFHVIGTSRDPSQYSGLPYDLWELDVASPISIHKFVRRVKRELGHINLLHCNAGRIFIGRPLQSSRLKMRLAMETIVDGHITLMQKLVPLMPEGEEDYARVIMTSSIAAESFYGVLPPPPDPLPLDFDPTAGVNGILFSTLLSAYTEAKARLSRFGVAMAQEQQNVSAPSAGRLEYPSTRTNLKVSVIHPVLVNTDLVSNLDDVIYGEDRNLKFITEMMNFLAQTAQLAGLEPEFAGRGFEQMAVLENPYLYTILANPSLIPDGTGGKADIQFGFLLGIFLSQVNTVLGTPPAGP